MPKTPERLTELLRDLEIIGRRIYDEIGDIASATKGMIPPRRAADFPQEEALSNVAAKYELPLMADLEKWTDVFDIQAGPWALHLSGNAVPTPQLVVTLRGNRARTSTIEPFVTMVRPAESFETVNLDSHGSGNVALLSGRSIILVQGDEVWAVHLSFRNSNNWRRGRLS